MAGKWDRISIQERVWIPTILHGGTLEEPWVTSAGTGLALGKSATIRLSILGNALNRSIVSVHALNSGNIFAFSPNFASATSYRSGVAFVSNSRNVLLRHNFPVSRLTASSGCLRIYCVLLGNRGPARRRCSRFGAAIAHRAVVRRRVAHLFRTFHHSSRPVTIVYNVANTLTTFCRSSLSIGGPHRHRVTTFHLLSGVPAVTTVYCGCSVNRPFICPHGSLSCTNGFLGVVFSAPYRPCRIGPVLRHTVSHVLVLRTSRRRGTSASAIHATNSSNTGPFTYVTTNVTSL